MNVRLVLFFGVYLFLMVGCSAEPHVLEDVELLNDFLGTNDIMFDVAEGSSVMFDPDSGVLRVNDFTLDLSSVKAYLGADSSDLSGYVFEGTQYDAETHPITDIVVTDDTVSIVYEGDRSITMPTEGSFNPMTREFTLDGNTQYTWAGNGAVTLSKDGELTLDFIANSDDTSDLTNFAIVTLPSGETLSPFAQPSSGVTPPSSLARPESGSVLFEQGGKRYTLDASGTVRAIAAATFTLDESGRVTELSLGFLETTNGRLFVTESFSLSGSGENTITITDTEVVVRSAHTTQSFYYEQKTNLVTLDVQGSGIVINGDKLLLYEAGSLKLKTVGSEWQKNSGNFKYTIESLKTYTQDGTPGISYSLKKDASGRIVLSDSEGTVITTIPENLVRLPDEEKPDDEGSKEEITNPIERAVHEAIIAARGRGLTWSEELAVLAREHSRDMAQRGSIGHEGFSERIRRAGCRGGAENVAMSGRTSGSPQAFGEHFTQMWMNSPGHRNNIMGGYTHAGIGIYQGPEGTYITQIFC